MPKTRHMPTTVPLPAPSFSTASPTGSADTNAVWDFFAVWALPIGTLTQRTDSGSPDQAEEDAWADLAARARGAWARDNPF